MQIALEKDTKGNIVYKKMLSPYDFIAYANEMLTDGTVINVTGQLKYQEYNGSIQCKKEIQSIKILKDDNIDESKFGAKFTQTMLLTKDSVSGKDAFDKEKSCIVIDAYVLEKMKEYNGHDLTEDGKNRGGLCVPLKKVFEFPVDLSNQERVKKITEKLFKVKKGTVTEATFEGIFVESGAAIMLETDCLQ